MAGEGHQTERGRSTLRLSPGPSPRIRWGERIPLEAVSGGVTVDLGAVKFVSPTLVLRLAASQTVHEAAGEPFSLVPPVDGRVRNYLARAGLAEQIGTESPSSSSDVLVPATRIEPRSDGVESTAKDLETAAASLPAALAQTREALVLAFSELGGNACSHGYNPHGTFVLAQQIGPSHLVLAVGDVGVGIPTHLGDALGVNGHTGEAKLIAKALEPGVTGVRDGPPEQNHGSGLPSLLETIRGLGMPSAELSIWSGTGRVSLKMRSQPASRRSVVNVRAKTPGTWVEVVLSSRQAGIPI